MWPWWTAGSTRVAVLRPGRVSRSSLGRVALPPRGVWPRIPGSPRNWCSAPVPGSGITGRRGCAAVATTAAAVVRRLLASVAAAAAILAAAVSLGGAGGRGGSAGRRHLAGWRQEGGQVLVGVRHLGQVGQVAVQLPLRTNIDI